MNEELYLVFDGFCVSNVIVKEMLRYQKAKSIPQPPALESVCVEYDGKFQLTWFSTRRLVIKAKGHVTYRETKEFLHTYIYDALQEVNSLMLEPESN